MQPTAQNIHTSLPNPEKFSLLVVSPYKDDRSAVSQILHNPCWRIEHATSLEDAGKRLHEKVASVVLCERDLPDGDRRQIRMARGPYRPFRSGPDPYSESAVRLWFVR